MKKALLKHVIDSRIGGKYTKPPSIPSYAFRGSEERIASKGGTVGDTTIRHQQVYTGNNIIGIATMHKSNLVPVFSQQDAEDIAHMRR